MKIKIIDLSIYQAQIVTHKVEHSSVIMCTNADGYQNKIFICSFTTQKYICIHKLHVYECRFSPFIPGYLKIARRY